jgi:hypothetical protein
MSLRQPPVGQDHRDRGGNGKKPKVCAPAKNHEGATDRWRDGRRDTGADREVAHDSHGVVPLVEIPHDSAHEHAAAARPETLEYPCDDQPVDGTRHRARRVGDQKDEHPAKQDGSATQPVGDRSVKQLPDRKPDQEDRDGPLHRGLAGFERPDDVGHRRREHVNPDDAPQLDGQQEEYRRFLGVCWGHGLAKRAPT